jgi:hypothetical protein
MCCKKMCITLSFWKIKEDEMREACGMRLKNEKCILWSENFKRRDHFIELDVDGRII